MFRSPSAENIDGDDGENTNIRSYRIKKVGRNMAGQQCVKNVFKSRILQERSICSAKLTSPPNALVKGKTDPVYKENMTTPIRRHETRTPLSQLTHSNQPSKRLSRLRSIHSQSPGATLLTQKPMRTPLRNLGGRNGTTSGMTPSRVSQSPMVKLSIAATDETDLEIATPSLDRRVHFFSDGHHSRIISNNTQGENSLRTPRRYTPSNIQGGNSLRTPSRSALKNVLRYSPSHVSGTPKIHRQSIASPLYVSDKSVSALKRIPLKQTPRSARTLLSSGPSRVRVQEKKRTLITKSNMQRKGNKNELEDILRTPSKRLLNSTVSSRIMSSRGKNTKPITSTLESTPSGNIISARTPKMKKIPISVSTALELDFDEEEENAICLWRDEDEIDIPVQEREINKALPTGIDGLEHEIMALDLVDMTENNNQNDESYDSIASQCRHLYNNKENISVPDIQRARNFDPVAFTLMNNGIEDREAFLIHDQAHCANITPKHTVHSFIPIMSNNLLDVMEHDEVVSLVRPIARYPMNNIEIY